jgi:hypothetical protein
MRVPLNRLPHYLDDQETLPAPLSHSPSTMNLILNDVEAQALRALLIDKTNLPTNYRHSATQEVYRSILDKLDTAKDGARVRHPVRPRRFR